MGAFDSWYFLKCCPISALEYGRVARQVGKFSGCSTHILCFTPAAVNASPSLRSAASSFTSSTTWYFEGGNMTTVCQNMVPERRGDVPCFWVKAFVPHCRQ